MRFREANKVSTATNTILRSNQITNNWKMRIGPVSYRSPQRGCLGNFFPCPESFRHGRNERGSVDSHPVPGIKASWIQEISMHHEVSKWIKLMNLALMEKSSPKHNPPGVPVPSVASVRRHTVSAECVRTSRHAGPRVRVPSLPPYLPCSPPAPSHLQKSHAPHY